MFFVVSGWEFFFNNIFNFLFGFKIVNLILVMLNVFFLWRSFSNLLFVYFFFFKLFLSIFLFFINMVDFFLKKFWVVLFFKERIFVKKGIIVKMSIVKILWKNFELSFVDIWVVMLLIVILVMYLKKESWEICFFFNYFVIVNKIINMNIEWRMISVYFGRWDIVVFFSLFKIFYIEVFYVLILKFYFLN